VSTPRKICYALIAVAVVQAAYYWGQLPDPMASHFNGAGRADGWSSKAAFFGIMFGMMAMMVAIFLYAPRALNNIPDRYVSLPYRDYWLSAENRAGTIRFISTQMAWFGAATLMLLVASIQFTIEANLGSNRELPGGFMWVFWLYIAYTVLWTIFFVGHFFRIRRNQRRPA
jgi:uncharacterized membrane protein